MTKAMPDFDRRYRNALQKLLDDEQIHPRNRALFKEFFAYEERKLKRINGLDRLDDSSYKTLYGYILRFRNTNRWFENKPWADLSREDIKRVYDDLEDGVIVNAAGVRYMGRTDYYNKVFKSKPFAMVGKDVLAKEVIEFTQKSHRSVRFILEKDFRKLIVGVRSPKALLLFWLAFDYGENISSLIQLLPSDFHRQIDPDTGDPEYRLNFRPEILKRSRRPRSEISNYPETVQLLDEILPEILPGELPGAGEPIFTFGYHYAAKLMRRAVKRTGVACQPNGEGLSWKDLRSGMACDLLNKGWTRDEVNARLGHTPSSGVLDAYINFMALERRRPKQRMNKHRAERRPASRDKADPILPMDSQATLIDRLQNERREMQKQIAAMKQMLMAELRSQIEPSPHQQTA